MALGALISAYQDAERDGPHGVGDGAALRATLPLAGRTLLEYQVRLARAAGAEPVVVMVERVTATLTAAVDRLLVEGMAVQLARSAEEAAAFFAAGDQVLVMAGGLFTDTAGVARVAASNGSAILTISDNIGLDAFERIDVSTRWAGLAIATGAQVGGTADMLGDWDLQSTLLRRLVQDDARRLAIVAGPGAPMLIMAGTPRDLEDAERRMFAAARGPRGDWVERFVTPIVEEYATKRLMGTAMRPLWLLATAAALGAMAVLFAVQGWFGAAVLALGMSVPLDGIADRLAALRLRPLSRSDPWRRALPLLALAALIAGSVRLVSSGAGWGSLLAGLTACAFFYALSVERRSAGASGGIAIMPWLASRKAAITLIVPFAIAGWWIGGLIAIAIYAGGSFLWLQRRTHLRVDLLD